jgi:S-formylglutathione hydrolase FrmB
MKGKKAGLGSFLDRKFSPQMNADIRRSFFAAFLGAAIWAASAFAQTPTPSPSPSAPTAGPAGNLIVFDDGLGSRRGDLIFPATVRNEKLDSKLRAREIPYRVILPASYANKPNDRFRVIYLLHGLFGHFDNWTNLTKIDEEYAKHVNAIIVMPEGGDGWYTDSATVPTDKYESYIIQELIPEIDKKFRTIADRKHRAIAGLSMGGYGAIKFGLKYPDKFSLVGSFSGALDAPLRGQKHQHWRPSIMGVFGPDGSQVRKDNDIYHLVDEVRTESVNRLPFFYLDCGTDDVVNFQNNRDFAGLLLQKKIPHEYRELPGAHTWEYWDSQVQEFLRLVGKRK